MTLLSPDEPPPVAFERSQGSSNFVIAVDHASARIPHRLQTLGLPPAELGRHIASDIGCLSLARRLSQQLDTPLVAQNYSRLVIDCNRIPGSATSIPTCVDGVDIPGNVDLSEEDVAARCAEIFEPYHLCLRSLLDERIATKRPTILIALHTMTDIFQGVQRHMHAAVLHHHDRRFADLMLDLLRRETDLEVGDNDPYVIEDSHFTVPHHAEKRGLACAAIEVRQDLVTEEGGQVAWAQRISRVLQAAERNFLSTKHARPAGTSA